MRIKSLLTRKFKDTRVKSLNIIDKEEKSLTLTEFVVLTNIKEIKEMDIDLPTLEELKQINKNYKSVFFKCYSLLVSDIKDELTKAMICVDNKKEIQIDLNHYIDKNSDTSINKGQLYEFFRTKLKDKNYDFTIDNALLKITIDLS
jgi:hypothetical protein